MSVVKRVAETAAIAVAIILPAQAYEAGPVAGGGAIQGKVVFRDTVPMKKIIPTKDVEVCGGLDIRHEEARVHKMG